MISSKRLALLLSLATMLAACTVETTPEVKWPQHRSIYVSGALSALNAVSVQDADGALVAIHIERQFFDSILENRTSDVQKAVVLNRDNAAFALEEGAVRFNDSVLHAELFANSSITSVKYPGVQVWSIQGKGWLPSFRDSIVSPDPVSISSPSGDSVIDLSKPLRFVYSAGSADSVAIGIWISFSPKDTSDHTSRFGTAGQTVWVPNIGSWMFVADSLPRFPYTADIYCTIAKRNLKRVTSNGRTYEMQAITAAERFLNSK